MKWPELQIQTAQGLRTGIAPWVISASRATDIPAFHARWFMNRLRAGYCAWQNPFNSAQLQYISFAKCKVFVFWSKDPRPLMPHLPAIKAAGYQFYFQFTLNNYEAEGLEPRVPALERRIAAFIELSQKLGKKNVIWRFDPIILGGPLSVPEILERIHELAERLCPWTARLVFSFVDMYKKTANNLKKINPLYREASGGEIENIASGLAKMNKNLTHPLELACCAEAQDLEAYGIKRARCIDYGLLRQLNPDLETAASKVSQGKLLQNWCETEIMKDRGQRALCRCFPAKDIGSYNSCMHLCAYCYANASLGATIKTMNRLDGERERL